MFSLKARPQHRSGKMSKKARRRPSWKNEPRPFYINLINEETGELFETIKVKKGSYLLHNMLERYGPIVTEKRLREALMDLAERTMAKHENNLHAKTPNLEKA